MLMRILAALLAAALQPVPLQGAQGGSFAEQTDRARGAVEEGRLLEAYEALQEAEYALWRSMEEMTLRMTVLVEEEPPFFGAYTPRGSNRYRPGEPILLYAEPVGYTIVEKDGLYSYSLKADVALLDPEGAVLGGRRDFGQWQFASRRPVTDFMMFFTYDFSGLAEGSYVIETIIRDQNSAKTVTVTTPIAIAP